MSENVDLLRRYFDAINRAGRSGDLEEWLSFFSEDVVWEAIEDAPDAGTYRGRDGLRGYFQDWLETVDNMRFERGEITDLGDFVVAEIRATATIKGTDAVMDLPYAFAVRIEAGKIAQGKEFRERDDALAYAKATQQSSS
jgi:ketosteroid isomerase-like protein